MRCLLTLIAVAVFVPTGVNAQSAVRLTARVSEVVTLSAAESIGAVSNGNTVRIPVSKSLFFSNQKLRC